MPADPDPKDHRPRVAAERRARMRKRLIESAMIVFAQRGIGASVIPDVIAAAGVSQGSFYNYFRTNDDLLAAVSDALSHDMVQMIESVVGDIEDPALRVATGIRLYLHLARSYPVVAQFLSGTGLSLVGKKSSVYEYLPSDIKEGLKTGTFDEASADVALDMVAGAGVIAVHRMAQGKTTKDYPERIVRAVLRSLGVSAASATKLTSAPLPKLVAPPESLLEKAQEKLTEMAEPSNLRA
ncbi:MULTISPECIES: TetR/AcrR family transcriptional regulator [Cupriavidus]|uniref:TetR/AcrR family transcriptional regulator n=1 Tax=Cupriavidus TaxID=106589 RepID=UPI001F2E08FF|nr:MULTISPECIES: TetR/AcrR family transcriptional regulator [Cupriavidus]MDF3885832.1 TetR/AcrR family transcriptional regulator [Cupriavidus basilensis]